MSSIDQESHAVLKGHLLLEEGLTLILEQYLFHREHLPQARLTFNQKLVLARSFCLRKNHVGEWELMQAINSLRNTLDRPTGSGSPANGFDNDAYCRGIRDRLRDEVEEFEQPLRTSHGLTELGRDLCEPLMKRLRER